DESAFAPASRRSRLPRRVDARGSPRRRRVRGPGLAWPCGRGGQAAMTAQRFALLVLLFAAAALLVCPAVAGGQEPTSRATLAAPPTHENPGPNEPLNGPDLTAKRWVKTRDCDHQRVVGNVRIDLRTNRPGTWTLRANQCEFTGSIYIAIDGH